MILAVLDGEKTNPIQSQTNPIRVSPQTCSGGCKNKANLFRIEYCVMRIAKRNLKKQTQFMKGQNKLKAINYKGLQRIFMVWQRMKTKPNAMLWPEIRSNGSPNSK